MRKGDTAGAAQIVDGLKKSEDVTIELDMNKLACALIATVTLTASAARGRAQVYPERPVGRPSPRGVLSAARRQPRRAGRALRRRRSGSAPSGELDVANIPATSPSRADRGTDATVEVDQDGARARRSRTRRRCCRSFRSTSSIARDVRRSGRAIPRRDALRGNGRNINISVTYNITAPVNTRLTAKSISGNIKVTDIKGDVSAESVSGDVRIGGSGRVGMAKSVSGNVEVADTQIDGTLEAGSVSGDVILRRLTARRIDTSSISGTVRMEDVQCDRDRRAVDQRRGGLFRPAGQGRPLRAEVALGRGDASPSPAASASKSTPRRSPARSVRISRSPRMGLIRAGVSGRSRAAMATAAPSSISRHSAETWSSRSAEDPPTPAHPVAPALLSLRNGAGRSVASRCRLILTSGRRGVRPAAHKFHCGGDDDAVGNRRHAGGLAGPGRGCGWAAASFNSSADATGDGREAEAGAKGGLDSVEGRRSGRNAGAETAAQYGTDARRADRRAWRSAPSTSRKR